MKTCPNCNRTLSEDSNYCRQCGTAINLDETHPLPPEHPDPLISTTIREYRIIEKIGEGGMASVYKAYHQMLKVHRVIKVPKQKLINDKRIRGLFIREARTATLLRHPNIATIHELFEHTDGGLFIVMEYVEGETLTKIIKTQGPLSCKRVLVIAEQICDGLAEAHRRHIIHRDISPHNIMIRSIPGEQDSAKVIDFGLAKPIDMLAFKDTVSTHPGYFIGKCRYSSPEQAGLLEPDENLDARTDVYSLGVVLYEMLSGDTPFKSNTPQGYMVKIATEKPPEISSKKIDPETPATLIRAISRTLKRDRSERHRNAGELLEDINRAKEEFLSPEISPGKNVPEEGETEEGEADIVEERPPLVTYYKAMRIPVILLLVITGIWGIWRTLSRIPAEVPGPPLTHTVLVKLNSDPEGAEVVIDGQSYGETPCKVESLMPGNYKAVFKKIGYEDLQEEITVASGENGPFTFVLKEKLCKLTVDAHPPGASVVIDGRDSDRITPVNIEDLPSGMHTIGLSKSGYKDETQEISLAAGESKTISFNLDLIPKRPSQMSFNLIIKTSPPGASIAIDGRDSGRTTPADIKDLPSGTHTILLSKPGYRDETQEISLSPGESKSIILDLAPLQMPASIFIDSGPPGAAIILDGKATGYKTPHNILDLDRGDHKIELKLDGYEIWQQDIQLQRGPNPKISALLKEVKRMLIIQTTPQTEVYLDGEKIGQTPYRGEWPWKDNKRHTLKLANHELGILRYRISHDELDDLPPGEAYKKEFTGILDVKSDPSGAFIKIDGNIIGPTPIRGYELPAGFYMIQAYFKDNPEEVVAREVKVRHEKRELLKIDFR
ncbi:PEGA domain-containing protein [Thermodesulfobacteriota bacterium]